MLRRFRVYLAFTINELKKQLAYKGVFYIFIFISLFETFISYFLWMAIYGSSTAEELGGLTRNEMITYVFMVYIAQSLVNITISDSISDDVVKGQVAMNLIKPINYRLSLVFQAVGKQIYYFLAPGVFIWIGLEVYKYFALGESVTQVVNMVLFGISCLLSFLLYVLFDFCFGMISFFTTYMFGMKLAKDAILNFLTGSLIPLSFFPQAIQRVFDYLPFSSMIYVPVMIYLGKYQGVELFFVLCRQIFWVVILYGLGSYLWSRVTKRLIVLGG